jgi:hypothetical protein
VDKVKEKGQVLKQSIDQEEKVLEKDFGTVVSDIKAIEKSL